MLFPFRPQPDSYPFHRYVQYLSARLYGIDRPFQLRCNKAGRCVGLDHGFEAGVLVRGPFGVGVFWHRVICPSSSAPVLRGGLSIRHQIVVVAQSALDIERRASCSVGISSARGQHTQGPIMLGVLVRDVIYRDVSYR
jgi:hypothetical protein